MALKALAVYAKQSNITQTSDTFAVRLENQVILALAPQEGEPAPSARIQVALELLNENSEPSAFWVDAFPKPVKASSIVTLPTPANAVRLVAESGTWTLAILQKPHYHRP